MKSIFLSSLITVFCSSLNIVGTNAAPTYGAVNSQPRSADTCADPSLAATWMQVFNPAEVAHALGPRAYTLNGITLQADTEQWQFQGDVFVAWRTAQNFTVPLYRYDSGTGTHLDYLYSTATSSPTPGFTEGLIIGYVYETQICGSVPLLGVWNKAVGDHYYTTQVGEHRELIATSGWTDAGIAGYVLPVGSAI